MIMCTWEIPALQGLDQKISNPRYIVADIL